MPEVHSMYVPVKSLGSVSASASTPLSFIWLSSVTVGSVHTSRQVNVYRSAHAHAHTHTHAAAWGPVSETKMHAYTYTHTGRHHNQHMDWKQT